MILIIRGHIRDSFNNLELLEFVKCLYKICPDLKIYIHTWNIYANNNSWRCIKTNYNKVTSEIIDEYFYEIQHLIKIIMIDDDTKIHLIGNLNGKVSSSRMPLHGWKNYWYSQYQIIKYIYSINIDENEVIVNTRFDLLKNSFHSEIKEMISFISQNKNNTFTQNIFINDAILGVDNIYIGNIKTMYILIYHFNFKLDNILKKYTNIFHQEELVILVNSYLFSGNKTIMYHDNDIFSDDINLSFGKNMMFTIDETTITDSQFQSNFQSYFQSNDFKNIISLGNKNMYTINENTIITPFIQSNDFKNIISLGNKFMYTIDEHIITPFIQSNDFKNNISFDNKNIYTINENTIFSPFIQSNDLKNNTSFDNKNIYTINEYKIFPPFIQFNYFKNNISLGNKNIYTINENTITDSHFQSNDLKNNISLGNKNIYTINENTITDSHFQSNDLKNNISLGNKNMYTINENTIFPSFIQSNDLKNNISLGNKNMYTINENTITDSHFQSNDLKNNISLGNKNMYIINENTIIPLFIQTNELKNNRHYILSILSKNTNKKLAGLKINFKTHIPIKR
jgi:hypothetical protein